MSIFLSSFLTVDIVIIFLVIFSVLLGASHGFFSERLLLFKLWLTEFMVTQYLGETRR